LAVKLPEGEEVLVPFAGALLLGVDLAAKSIRMTLPEGLAGINRASEERGEEKG
jgi:ribosomal 30S subunit maturation factor RimM